MSIVAPPADSLAAEAQPSQPPSASKPNLDGILLLEQPFARVPFDELRRQQRSQQRLIEREFLFCSTTIDNIHAKAATIPASHSQSQPQQPTITAADAVRNLDAMLGRLRGLKRKMQPIADQSKHMLRMAQSRTDHLSNLHAIQSTASPEFAEWSKTRLDRMLVDYMLRRGYRASAHELAASKGIQDLVDTDLFAEIANIENSLMPPGWQLNNDDQGEAAIEADSTAGDADAAAATAASSSANAEAAHDDDAATSNPKPSCALALAWCSENKTMLRKIKSPLEFDLRLQEYIELARIRTPKSIKEAIAYLRRHLLPMQAASAASAKAAADKKDDKEAEYDRAAYEAIQKQISRAMGLIACGPDGWAYEDLYTPYRWLSLRDSFRVCALQIHSLPLQPILHIALSAGLSSLKVPACYSHEARVLNGAGAGVATGAPGHLGGRTAADAASATLLDGRHGGDVDTVSVPSRFPPAVGGAAATAGATTSLEAAARDGERDMGTPLSYLGNMMATGVAPLSQAHGHAATATATTAAAATGAAYGIGGKSDDRNIDCPICDTDGLGTLAREVPWSHHANSTLVCSMSGKVMDENNPPMALPNGRVYALSVSLSA
ncbi:GID complex subunit containing RING finger motif [Thecaphora frezii]